MANGLVLNPKKDWTDEQKDEDRVNQRSYQDVDVLIHKGEYLKGILDIKTVGTSKKGIVHTIWLEYGFEKARNFLTETQKIVNNWFSGNGFTVGISDTICDKKTFDEIAEILFERKKDVEKLIMQLQRGDLELQPGRGLFESFEKLVNQSLNEARDASGKKLIDAVDTRNNILHMVNAGSKGKQDNLSQILACVG